MGLRRAAAQRFERAHAERLPVDAHGVVVGADTIRLEAAQPPGARTNGARRAALVLHGFNDTPQSMAYLAAAIHRAGWTVLAPRLPGHGVTLPVMARESRLAAWREAVASAYLALRAEHDTVVVCGQSMGGALAALLAHDHPDMPALALLAPYFNMPRAIQWQVAAAWLLEVATPYHAGSGGERSLHDPEAKARALGPGVITARTMTELRHAAAAADRILPDLRVPTLYLQSREDNRISARDAARHFARIGSRDKALHWLEGCGHIISADYCRDEVASQVIRWFDAHSAP